MSEQALTNANYLIGSGSNYPNLIALFEHLDVETQASDMSFAVSNPNGYEWSSNPAGLFAQKRNLLSPAFHKFWLTILKFNNLARTELAAGKITDATLGEWLDRHGFSGSFRENYILPMGAAIWSTPQSEMMKYPALSFFNFFENHHLMHKERPKWRTVTGGSRHYVSQLKEALGSRIKAGTEVKRVAKSGAQVKLLLGSGAEETFDQVIMASHSDQSARMLDESFADRAALLAPARYRANQIFLHRDPALMPKRKAAWAAWNVLQQKGDDVCLTYWMNILQGLPMEKPLFVTLNPETLPAADKTFASFDFDHPQFDLAAQKSVTEIKRTNGQDGLWFAGAWMGSGFHEDGLKSGLEAALSLGGAVPWEAQNITTRKMATSAHA